jgi:hypothetical protein
MAKKRQYEVGENKLVTTFQFRLSDEEKDKIKVYSESKDISMAELIMNLLNKEISRA